MAKVLIIDDELETLEIHKAYLKAEHTVYTFQSGAEALDQIMKIKPDIILLDIEMPFMNGFQVLEWLRERKECAQIPVVGVTGQRDRATALSFIGKGGVGYLMKPVEKNLMLERVREILRTEAEKKNKKKVLIVDDELESLLLYKNILQEKYNVTALNSGKMAVEYLQKFVPDLIILDYQMPLYNGRAVYQMIRKMERQENVPIIFLTGTTEKEVLVECAALMPQGVVLKSAGKDALLEKVSSVLEKNRGITMVLRQVVMLCMILLGSTTIYMATKKPSENQKWLLLTLVCSFLFWCENMDCSIPSALPRIRLSITRRKG